MQASSSETVAVEAIARGSVQGSLLQQVCRRASSDCQTNEILCSGWPQECPLVPSRALETCRQVMSAE